MLINSLPRNCVHLYIIIRKRILGKESCTLSLAAVIDLDPEKFKGHLGTSRDRFKFTANGQDIMSEGIQF